MSAPSEFNQNESASSNVEESTNSITKTEATGNNEEASLCDPVEIAKKEPASQSVSNGALAESEAKVIANGLESNMNGQEEKPGDGQQRPIPDLLPLTTSPTPVPQGSSNATSSNQPKQNTTLQLPLNTTSSPVVATKSAPPPISSSPKTRGRTSSQSIASSSPSKEQSNSSMSEKSAEGNEENVTVEKKETKRRKSVAKKRDSIASSDSTEKGDGDSADGDVGRKSKRARTRTQPFQSSDMDTSLLKQIIKASAQGTPAVAPLQSKAYEEKLVVFFKGEFLAVRNAEGGFYVCQAMQNINRGSHKIRIRWLSQAVKEEPKTKRRGKATEAAEPPKDETGFDIYTPDFYDTTDFECILTNLELEKFGKDRYGLPEEERTRTENILRRALEVEQGKVDNLELTEEHPDGLDVSLFHDESQLKRKRRKKGKQTTDEDGSSSSSSSENESDPIEPVATTSRLSRRVSKPSEPEPKTSTSGVASTSSGGGKRTRAAAARQKIPMRYREDDDDEDSSDEDDDDVEEEEDSSSDSDAGKRRRGRPTTRRAQKTPPSKARGKATPVTRTTRGKKLATQKKGPIPIIKKAPKTPTRQTPESASKRRKMADAQEEKDESSAPEKVVTVDVEMTANEASSDSKAKAEPVETAKGSEIKEVQADSKEVEEAKTKEAKTEEAKTDDAKTDETKATDSTEAVEVDAKNNENTNADQKSEESPKEEIKPSSDEPSSETEPEVAVEAKETPEPDGK